MALPPSVPGAHASKYRASRFPVPSPNPRERCLPRAPLERWEGQQKGPWSAPIKSEGKSETEASSLGARAALPSALGEGKKVSLNASRLAGTDTSAETHGPKAMCETVNR